MKIFPKMAVLTLSFAFMGAFAQEEGEILGEYGAITVQMLNGKRTALISSESIETVEINEDVEIDSAYFDRKFSGDWNKPSTLMLPFPLNGEGAGCLSQFAQVYEMTGISITGSETWQIDAMLHQNSSYVSGPIEANRPYLVRPGGAELKIGDHCLSKSKPVVMNTTQGTSNMKILFDKWEFRGMYSYKKWEEGDSDLGYVYGFAEKEKEVDGKLIKKGQFVKGKAGVFIRPFRAYLIYTGNSALAKSAKETASLTADELPNEIDVVFHDENGDVTAIHSLNTISGEFTNSSTGWYDMKGRKLNKKPTIKGAYFYNGNKVVIK